MWLNKSFSPKTKARKHPASGFFVDNLLLIIADPVRAIRPAEHIDQRRDPVLHRLCTGFPQAVTAATDCLKNYFL